MKRNEFFAMIAGALGLAVAPKVAKAQPKEPPVILVDDEIVTWKDGRLVPGGGKKWKFEQQTIEEESWDEMLRIMKYSLD